ncbi:MAG: geranylgeranyl reductase family protein [Promethearchaeota archaeon]
MEKVENCDIVIVGGSIAGNYLAYLLSKKNYRIIVIEEHGEIGYPFQCAGIVSKKLTQLITIPQTIILNRVKVAKLISPSGLVIKLAGEEEPLIIDRIALDRYFYEKIKHLSNVTYLLNEKFKSFSPELEHSERIMRVQTSKRQIKCKLVIGCDGPLSTVARLLGVKNKVIYGAQVRVKASFNDREAVMIFKPIWKELFGWIVPEGNYFYRIGLACEKNPASKLNYLLEYLQVSKKNIVNRQGGIIPLGTMNRLAFDNVLLLGDAACQVKATTGGGIIMLLTAAKIAAQCIDSCFKNNDFSHRIIEKYYERPCRRKIGRELKIHLILRILFLSFTPEEFDHLFSIIKMAKIEHLITLYGDMDFPLRFLLKLLRNFSILRFLTHFLKNNKNVIYQLIKIFMKRR